MRRLRIAVDVDDVLAENAAGIVAFSNQRWGTNLTVDDYDEHWAKMWQVDNAEVERRTAEIVSTSLSAGYGHIGGALEVLERLAQHHHLMIATSRCLQVKGDTIAWIDEHFPGIFASTAVYFSGIWDELTNDSHRATKAELMTQINADVLIDDQLKHCQAVAAHGRNALLFGDYAWNQAATLPAGVVRCANWYEVEVAIERLASDEPA
jgi:hypothetical protein